MCALATRCQSTMAVYYMIFRFVKNFSNTGFVKQPQFCKENMKTQYNFIFQNENIISDSTILQWLAGTAMGIQ